MKKGEEVQQLRDRQFKALDIAKLQNILEHEVIATESHDAPVFYSFSPKHKTNTKERKKTPWKKAWPSVKGLSKVLRRPRAWVKNILSRP